MHKVWLATNSNCSCYIFYDGRPGWDGREEQFTLPLNTKMWDSYEGPGQPPPGECVEYILTPADDLPDLPVPERGGKVGLIEQKDREIAELKKQLAERLPGVMPEVVRALCDSLDSDCDSTAGQQLAIAAVRDYFAPPAGHEWQVVDKKNPIAAEDVGRDVAFRDGGRDVIITFDHTSSPVQLSCRVWFKKDGRRHIGDNEAQHSITHILRPVAPPFVFDGSPGMYLSTVGKIAVIDRWCGGLMGDDGKKWFSVNSDGTFDGGKITGRVE